MPGTEDPGDRCLAQTHRVWALRLRCPCCGDGELFAGWFRMHPRCRGCGLKFEREDGYFLGSIYLSYGVALVLALLLHLLMELAWEVALTLQIVVVTGVIAAFGLWFFRYGRALWLAFDLRFDPSRVEEFAPPGSSPASPATRAPMDPTDRR